MMYTLRFDVETLIIATTQEKAQKLQWLRFDVETLIIATLSTNSAVILSCGLM